MDEREKQENAAMERIESELIARTGNKRAVVHFMPVIRVALRAGYEQGWRAAKGETE